MKKIYILTFLMTSFLCQAQIVNIPDANFKSALLNDNVVDTDDNGTFDSDADLNNDGEIQVTEAELVVSLNVSFKNISSLIGIAEFSNITTLYCTDNPLTELDVSSLTSLEILGCWDIDQVVNLDFSSNPNLRSIECDANDSLEFVNIQNGNNGILERFWANSSPNLQCIQVDDFSYADSQICDEPISWCKDITADYSEDCSLGLTEFSYIKLEIHPNPVVDELTIESNTLINSFEIYNSTGGQIMKKKFRSNKVDLSNLDSGIYFLKMHSQNKSFVRKIVKK